MAQQLRWIWAWRTTNRREVLAIIALIVILAAAAFFFINYPGGTRATSFGPEWACTYPGRGDPVCVKKPTAAADASAPSAK